MPDLTKLPRHISTQPVFQADPIQIDGSEHHWFEDRGQIIWKPV